MKNKILGVYIALLLTIVYVARGVYVNSDTLAPEIIKYKIGIEVPIEEDFFDTSSEKMNGYSVTVTDTNILSIGEFESQYGDFRNEMHAEYIYIITTTFKNNNSLFIKDIGIDLGQYILQENSYINFLDREAYSLINGFDSIMFALRENSEMELSIPFGINPEYIDIEKLKSKTPTLVVSLYPHKKIIELN